jgi:outer membrane receptor protein involved in Fe transport
LRNPSLKPFFSDNFEVGLEYYFPSGGSVTLAAFQKNMDGAFATMRRSLTSPLLGELSLPANFLNWDAVTTVNLGRTRVSGLEFSAQYTLTALPERIGTLAFFLSGTLLNTSGDTQNLDANALSKKTAGFGISYYKGPVIARLNGAYTGRANLVPQSFAPGALRYDDARLILDLSLEYQVSRHFALTFNAYNLTDEILYNRRFTSANTPAYSTVNNNVWFPMKGTVGIKGTF